MADLSTQYLGLTLKNPIVVGSSGLTRSAKSIRELEQAGAGAVVLKSIFEEEIAFEYEDILKEAADEGVNLDQFDYYDYQLKGEKLDRYIGLIEECKKSVSIPVIASINCVYSHEWTSYAKMLEKAGADALELNVLIQEDRQQVSGQPARADVPQSDSAVGLGVGSAHVRRQNQRRAGDGRRGALEETPASDAHVSSPIQQTVTESSPRFYRKDNGRTGQKPAVFAQTRSAGPDERE